MTLPAGAQNQPGDTATAPPAVQTAPPSCVAVIGVGRSGTSATSGLLVQLGLASPQPEDLVPATSSNERGHWESQTLIRCNSRLLRDIKCSPNGPPEPVENWRDTPGYLPMREVVDQWIPSTFAGAPVALKDPRMCLTLAFWRDVLPPPIAAVLVLRDPIRNARSREARDSMPVGLALAIWDRYTRCIVQGLAGLPTMVVEYDAMMADPARASAEMATFLRQLGIGVAAGTEDAAATFLEPSLRHQTQQVDEYAETAAVQSEMFQQLAARRGVHAAWEVPSTLPPPPLWVDDILRVQRKHDLVQRELRVLRKTRLHRLGAGMRRVGRMLPGRSES